MNTTNFKSQWDPMLPQWITWILFILFPFYAFLIPIDYLAGYFYLVCAP